MNPRRRSAVVRYGLAVAAVVMSFALIAVPAIGKVEGSPAVILLLAVFFSARVGGRDAGLLATALIILVTVGPHPNFVQLMKVGLFLGVGLVISHLVGALDDARHRARTPPSGNSGSSRRLATGSGCSTPAAARCTPTRGRAR